MDIELVGIIYLAFFLFSLIFLPRVLDKTRERARQAREARHLEASKQWEYQMKAMALTCPRCGLIAMPIPASRNRYACPECNNQFSGDPHNVPLPPAA
jgi:hypothetical protein